MIIWPSGGSSKWYRMAVFAAVVIALIMCLLAVLAIVLISDIFG